MLDTLIGTHASLAALILRIVLGVVFVAHGYPKLFKEPGPKGVSGFLQTLKVPAPLFFAYVVGIVEFFGGILVIIGLLTRPAAILIAINMLVAMWTLKFKTGLVSKVMEGGWVGGYELDLVLFAMALALAVSGAGAFSIDRLL
jgi:putative oxidoreductase